MAVDDIAKVRETNADQVRALHRALMDRSPSPELGGVVRTTQNWLGGNSFNPCDADFPAVVQVGLVHAQLETFHPFADGNGRTGRALIHVTLGRRNEATSFVPPVSRALATNSSGYSDGLASLTDVISEAAGAAEGVPGGGPAWPVGRHVRLRAQGIAPRQGTSSPRR